jgi:mannose-1-phosphate guanylyltransferase
MRYGLSKKTIYPVILAGGKGERFWPYSNSNHPKQLLPLVTSKTMLEDILEYIEQLNTQNPVHIIVSANLEEPIQRLLGDRSNIVLIAEPEGKNTAAAIALASVLIQQKDPNGVMVVLTADHAIAPPQEFVRAIHAAVDLASREDTLVTFGIAPNRPETGYGYIESAESLEVTEGLKAYKVSGFREKPNAERAEEYMASGKHFWNSGMFAWRVDYLWGLFESCLPEMYEAFKRLSIFDEKSRAFSNQLEEIYQSFEGESIDYGIMEKAPNISVVIPEFSWDDIGSWAVLDRRETKDSRENIAIGNTVSLDCFNVTSFAQEGLVATYGIRDVLVVQQEGVTLVIHKDKVPDIKNLVAEVKKKNENRKYL